MSSRPNLRTILEQNDIQLNQLSREALNKRDNEGKTLLHWAVILEKLPLIEKLIKHGCRLDICDNTLHTPLHYSIKDSDIEKCLLKYGSPIRGCTELHLAAARGDIKRIDEILLKSHFLQFYTDKHLHTPLYYAVQNGHESAAKHLIDKGAPVDWVDTKQRNLVELAKKDGKDTPLSKFLEARISLSVTETDLLVKSFKKIIEKEYEIAKKLNKKMIVMLGEIHGVYSIRELEKQFLKVAKEIGIHQLAIELPAYFPQKYPIELAAEQLGMKVSRVDTHFYRDEATFDQRNIEMTSKVKHAEQDCVLLVGASHLKGILSNKSVKLPPEKFHVVPFNLGPIASLGIYAFVSKKRKRFIDDKDNVIQVSREGITQCDVVLNKLNVKTTNPNPPSKIINFLGVISTIFVICYPIYLLYVYVGILKSIAILLGAAVGGFALYLFKEREKTFGLKDCKVYAKDDTAVIPQERLKAFMDGTRNSVFYKMASCLVYRDWRYMRDYYAGCAAKETGKEKLINSVKARIK